MHLLRIAAWQRSRRRSRNSAPTAFTEAVGWRGARSSLLEVTAEPGTVACCRPREPAPGRPAMGAITHAIGRLVASAQNASHLEPDELQRLVADEANALIAGRDRAAASIAVHLAPSLGDALVLTHSASATVREAVLHPPPARLFCTPRHRSRRGGRLAEDLRSEGLDVELVEDYEVDRALETAPRACRSGHRLRGRLDSEQDRDAPAGRGRATVGHPEACLVRAAEARTDSFSERGGSAHRDPSEPVMITSRDRSQAGIAKSPDQAPEGR